MRVIPAKAGIHTADETGEIIVRAEYADFALVDAEWVPACSARSDL